ncbi:MAG: divalent-cation tolerance protein CutA [Candidatus Competibacterales bacterium]
MTVDYVVVLCTCSNRAQGRTLADGLVTQRLAACVNMVPGVESIYTWRGEVQCDEEVLLVIKTHRRAMAALTAHLERHHPYDVPEVIALPLEGGSNAYLQWIDSCVTSE